MPVQWRCKHFHELTVFELYAILQLRIEVFIVEQNCPFQDADGKDQDSYHLMGWENELLVAYSRLVPAAVAFKEVSIGRVVSSPKARRLGLGRSLMQESIAECYRLFGQSTIRIGAQLYLKILRIGRISSSRSCVCGRWDRSYRNDVGIMPGSENTGRPTSGHQEATRTNKNKTYPAHQNATHRVLDLIGSSYFQCPGCELLN